MNPNADGVDFLASTLSSPPVNHPAAQRILVADDDPQVRDLLETSLRSDGYAVLCAIDGHELVQMAQRYTPHLMLVDLIMPQMDGYEAIRQMRNDTRISHIPMLILTAHMRPDEIVVGFDTGADDYITKPFEISEVLARVRSHLRRAARQPLLNPLSGLPGGALLAQELHSQFARRVPLALLHADLDNFKTFNDTYGFSRGDRAILLVGTLLQAAIAAHGNSGDFIGHVGGDDFVVLTTPDRIDTICRETLAAFDRDVRGFYLAEDWQRGYLTGVDRFGVLRRFRLLSLSIGGTTNSNRSFSDIEEFARSAAEMKHYAKLQSGSCYAIDQRSMYQPHLRDRRLKTAQHLIVASADTSLRNVLDVTFQRAGYAVQTAASIEGMAALLEGAQPQCVIVDAQLGPLLWPLCDGLAAWPCPPRIVVLACGDRAEIQTTNAVMLHIPLPLSDIVVCVDKLMSEEQ